MRTRGPVLWFGFVTLLAGLHLASHFATIESLLPHQSEPDAALVRQSILLRGEGEWDDSAWAKYPHGLSACMAVWPRDGGDEGRGADAASSRSLPEHLRRASRDFRAARGVIFVFSAAAILASYCLARRFLAPAWSALAAGLFATSLLFQDFAHQARPHAAIVAPISFALLASARWARRGGRGAFALALATCGVAFTTLHSASIVWIGFALAAGVRLRRARDGQSPAGARSRPVGGGTLDESVGDERRDASSIEAGARRRARADGLLALIACGLVVFAALRLGYPFLFDGPREANFEPSMGSYAFPHWFGLERFTATGFAAIARALRGYDPALAGLLVLAAAVWIASALVPGSWRRTIIGTESSERRVDALVLCVPIALYLVAIGSYGRTFQRFAMPALPFFALFAAAGLARVHALVGARSDSSPSAARSERGGASRWLAPSIGLIALATSARASWKLHVLRTRPDTVEEAARWITESLDARRARVLCIPLVNLPLALPILEPEDGRVADSPLKLLWTRYLAALPAGALDAPLAPVLPLGPGGRLPMTEDEYPARRGVVESLVARLAGTHLLTERGSAIGAAATSFGEEVGELARRFSPWPAPGEGESGLTFTSDTFYDDVSRAERLGPLLELWELPVAGDRSSR